MKIRNNKGFAITTVIYGLSIMGLLLVAIMMATMAANRNNTREISKSIEEELNFIKGSERSFEYDNGGNDTTNIPRSQEYIVPEGKSGFYKVELWGSQGGGPTGGLGAYTSGVIKLNEGDRLYFYVGRHVATKGGRATEVRVISGAYGDAASYRTRIMVAAGGGTNPNGFGGTLYGYNNTMASIGGAINANQPLGSTSFTIVSPSTTNGTLMGFKTGYARSGLNHYSTGNFTATYNGNGGDGYYSSNDANVGGTSYISGYGGCETIGVQGTRNSATDARYAPTFVLQKTSYNEETDVTSYTSFAASTAYVFVDGRMIPGVNFGDGKARISLVATTTDINKIRKNTNFNDVAQITDCVTITGKTIPSMRIAAISNGIDYGGVVPTSASGTRFCASINIPAAGKNLDEIDVWHYTTLSNVAEGSRNGLDGVDIPKHQLTVKKTDNSTYNIVSDKSTAETETVTGLRYSAYQPNPNEAITNGVYYIVPVLSETSVLTAPEKPEEDVNALEIEPFMSYKRQKWSIEVITDTSISPGYRNGNAATYEYKIVEQARYKAMTISRDENMIFNEISANRYFNNYRRDTSQIWKITPVGDGTYTIQTVTPYTLTDGQNSGYLTVNSNSQATTNQRKAMIGRYYLNTERYKLISANYFSKSG